MIIMRNSRNTFLPNEKKNNAYMNSYIGQVMSISTFNCPLSPIQPIHLLVAVITARRALPWPPTKLFWQVSQSESANLFELSRLLVKSAGSNFSPRHEAIERNLKKVKRIRRRTKWVSFSTGSHGFKTPTKLPQISKTRGTLMRSFLNQTNWSWPRNVFWKARSIRMSLAWKAGGHRWSR